MKDSRTRTALLVVDVQNDVVASTWRRDEVVATIARMVDGARSRAIPVIWVRHHADDLVEGTDGWQIVPQLVPSATEPIIDKAWGDAFAETTLEAELERLDVGHLLLCGAISNHCVNATMFGALHRGYDVTLIQDAHTAHEEVFDDPRLDADLAFPAHEVVINQNLLASFTRLPGVTVRLASAAEAFTG